jgi:sulfur-oxidizing protein SoxX
MRRAAALVITFAAAGFARPAFSAGNDGLDLFVRPDKGHCIACHQLPEGAGPARRANIGPRLEGARMRALGRDALRALITDPMRANPDTVMPPFGRHHILDAAEIDRIVDFLYALP